MTRDELLQELVRRGIRLTAADGQLRINAPKGGLNDALRDALRTHKTALLGLLGEHHRDRPAIEGDEQHRFDPFPMSDLQGGFYIGQHGSVDYHVRPHYYNEIDWPGLDVERYQRAWHRALSHHLGSIATVGPDLMLHPLRAIPPLRFRCHDLRGKPATAVRAHLEAVRRRMMRDELPLDRWPWLDWEITLYDKTEARVHYNHNNFFSDGPGTQRLLQLVERFYHEPAFAPPPLDITYRDCVLALERLAASERGLASHAYWEQRLSRLPPPPSLPLVANANPRTRSYLCRRKFVLDADRWTRFKTNARNAGVTPSNGMAALYAELIARWSNMRHFILSNMVTRRFPLHPRIREVVGNFASLYPLEIDLREGETFAARAQTIQRQLTRDLDNLYWGGMQVFQALNARRGEPGRAACPYVIGSGLFMTALDPNQFSCLETPQVLLDHQYWELEDGRLYAVWDVMEALFPEGLIADMWHGYGNLMHRLSEEPELWQAHHLITLPERQRRVRAQANATAMPPPAGILHRALRGNAQRFPDKPAVIDGSQTLCYGELERQVRSLAHVIAAQGGGRHMRIGVIANKGIEQIVGVLGVLTVGAAYVPLDPGLPGDRLQQLIADADIGLAVVDRAAVAGAALPNGLARLVIDEALGRNPDSAAAPADPCPEDAAYIIYTSGSTGKPKGVVVDHRAALNTIVDVNRRFDIGRHDRLFGISALNFDLSVYDIFGTLEAGATLVLPTAEAINAPARWAETIRREGVTVWNSVPALMQLLVEAAGDGRLRGLRRVMLSGDWIPVDLPQQIRNVAPDCRVIGMGGATEAAIWSIYHEIDQADPNWSSIPYGRPLANQQFHILDSELQHCPDWVGGQICIAGHGLALGYWNDPEKTAASFIVHPRTGERLYLTGDMGRYRPGGDIEFLGRSDSQVKIQGYRVELGEIETALRVLPGVLDAAVVALGSGESQGRWLAAFVVVAQSAGAGFSAAALRHRLADTLPGYMVPQRIEIIGTIPLTGNGKVDRKALSTRLTQCSEQSDQRVRAAYAAARTPEETTIVAIWEQVLDRSPIGIFDDFFELGGNSLAAVRILARIDEATSVALPLVALLEGRTVAGLSEWLGSGHGVPEVDLSPLIRIGTAGSNTYNLFLVHPAGGSVFCYRPLAEALDATVYAFQARGLDGSTTPQTTIDDMAQCYIEALRDVQPHGPYRLGGWSSGAVIAFEIAHRLEAAGERVERLIMIDGPAPHASGDIDEDILVRWFIEDLNEGIAPERLRQVDLSAVPPAKYLECVLEAIQGLPSGLAAPQLAANYGVFKAVIGAVGRYKPGGRIAADIDVFKAQADTVSEFQTHPAIDEPCWGWTAFTCGKVNTFTVPGDHYSIVVEPQVSILAHRLTGPSIFRPTVQRSATAER